MNILLLVLSLVLIFEYAYYLYYLYKNKKGDNAYYRDLPSNESPAIIGYMVKENVDGNDIMATILDLWNKNYIDIKYELINNDEKCVIYDLEKDRVLLLKDYENYLLDEMFKNSKRIILDEFINSKKFEIVFRNVGNMISKRVDIKSTHIISKKRIVSKINFLVNYLVLGFSIFIPYVLLVNKNINISIIISYIISLLFFIFIKKLFVKSNYGLENLVIGYSFFATIVYFGFLLIIYLIGENKFEFNFIVNMCNMLVSVLFFINIFINNRKLIISIIDYIILLYGVLSIILLNSIGICASIVYISLKIYNKSPKHIYLENGDEFSKWISLRDFLNDFTLINDRTIKEISIWEKYLIYAIAMGVNKKNILEYGKLANIKLINKNFLEKNYIENIDF